jgi:hypothetical protein
VQSNLNRSLRYREQPGDCSLRQVPAIAQRQELSIASVEPAERGVKIGSLDGGQHPLVVSPLEGFDGGNRLGAHARALPEGLVADDRRQPFGAPVGVTQSAAATPGPKQSVLGYVLCLAWVARIAIGHTQADPVRFAPLPSVA